MKPILYISLTFVLVVPAGAQDCTAAGCHADQVEMEYLHVPVEDDDCGACHDQVKKRHPDGRGNEFELVEESILDLCTGCHDVTEEYSELHQPVEDGECTTCHNPHQSNFSNLLRGETTADVCNDCHEVGQEEHEYTHGPVAVGACDVCHSGHDNTKGYLLRYDEVNSTCYECHETKKEEITNFAFQHDPVEESCSNCHSPHSSEAKFQLIDPAPDLCFGCHDEIQEGIEGDTTVHKAVEKDKTCMNCHNPHGSSVNKNLKSESFDLCLSCHNKNPDRKKGGLANMKRLLDRNEDWHGPIRDKDCTGCHQPHSSANFRLLKHRYPASFYERFDVENYALCYQCHPAENVFDQNTAVLTNFRDGDRNLHYLHINREKGRTCRACHETHASQKPYHIREGVPFGKWLLPINFTPSDKGGSCAPGCHSEKTYRRDRQSN
ncbi:MAG: cytochrome c3 family protein [Fidelibacterota bacterium]